MSLKALNNDTKLSQSLAVPAVVAALIFFGSKVAPVKHLTFGPNTFAAFSTMSAAVALRSYNAHQKTGASPDDKSQAKKLAFAAAVFFALSIAVATTRFNAKLPAMLKVAKPADFAIALGVNLIGTIVVAKAIECAATPSLKSMTEVELIAKRAELEALVPQNYTKNIAFNTELAARKAVTDPVPSAAIANMLALAPEKALDKMTEAEFTAKRAKLEALNPQDYATNIAFNVDLVRRQGLADPAPSAAITAMDKLLEAAPAKALKDMNEAEFTAERARLDGLAPQDYPANIAFNVELGVLQGVVAPSAAITAMAALDEHA